MILVWLTQVSVAAGRLAKGFLVEEGFTQKSGNCLAVSKGDSKGLGHVSLLSRSSSLFMR